MINEAGFPKCLTRTDCRPGKYCETSYTFDQDAESNEPTCSDCGYIEDWMSIGLDEEKFSKVLDEKNLKLLPIDENRWYYGMKDPDIDGIDTNNPTYMCAAWASCVHYTLLDACDFEQLNMFT